MKKSLAVGMSLIFCISFFHLFPFGRAQAEDTSGTTEGFQWSGFQWNGDIELGYRFADIGGSRLRYKETVNLMDGLKLFDLSLMGRAVEGSGNSLIDYFRLSIRDIGDPYPGGRFELKKKQAYNFVASYRQYDYFTDRTDAGFLTDFTSFNATIRRGTLLLSLFPKEDIKLNFGYNYAGKDGDAKVPRPLLEAQDQDLNERYHEYYASADFSLGVFDLFVKQSYWYYKNNDDINGPIIVEDRNETTNTYVSTLKGNTRVGERLDLSAGYVYAHSEGRAELQTNPGIFVLSGKGKTNFNTHIAELGLSYILIKNLILHADYRFDTTDQNGHSNTDTLLPAPANAATDFNLTAHTSTFQLEWIPLENLTLRGGYRIQSEDVSGDVYVSNAFDGGKDPGDTQSLNQGWVASADWKPFPFLRMYGTYEGANFSDPYTWISPDNQNIAKFKIKYDTPIRALSLIGSFLWNRRVNPDHDYRRNVQDYTITATYQPMDTLSVDGSFTYENIKDSKEIFTSAGAVTPVPKVSFDSSATIYSGGVSWDFYKGLGVGLRGNYAKTREETRESYASGVISAWYKNKCVTPIVSFERTYLVDRQNRRDSFDVTLVTLSLRKEF
jgi:hypothetical protein